MNITDESVELANSFASAQKAAFPTVMWVRYDRRIARIVIALDSGLELAFSPKHAQGLENAHPIDLMDIEITPSGLGIHFPRLNADLYLPALLEGFLGSKHWVASQSERSIEKQSVQLSKGLKKTKDRTHTINAP